MPDKPDETPCGHDPKGQRPDTEKASPLPHHESSTVFHEVVRQQSQPWRSSERYEQIAAAFNSIGTLLRICQAIGDVRLTLWSAWGLLMKVTRVTFPPLREIQKTYNAVTMTAGIRSPEVTSSSAT